MSDAPHTLDQQIAALEAALQLPLPEESRRQLTENLRVLHDQRAAGQAAIQDTTEVSGALHGNAVGVNLGTVQSFFGSPPPAAAGSAAPDVLPAAIDDQRELLVAHRHTLAVYLKQQATLSTAFAPPGVTNGIREARAGIQRAKASLHAWGVDVTDLPDD
jgi:DNA-binding transcriptional LysR family regulator